MPSKKLSDCVAPLAKAFTYLTNAFQEEYPHWQMVVCCTHRPPEEQFDLFKKGRELNEDSNRWEVVDARQVVTNKDGTKLLSRHNDYPARAVDVELYGPNRKKFWDFNSPAVEAGGETVPNPWKWLRDTAGRFGLVNGGSWTTIKDFPHFQLR